MTPAQKKYMRELMAPITNSGSFSVAQKQAIYKAFLYTLSNLWPYAE